LSSTQLSVFKGLLVILLALFIASCHNDLDKVRVEIKEKIPLAITRDFISLYSDSGRVVLQIEGSLREDYSDIEFYSEMPEGIKLTFFDANKRVMAKLTANYALIKGGGMWIKDSVKMESAKNGTLITQSLYWNSEKQEISTVDAVEIRQQNKVIFGQGLKAKQDFSEFTILVVVGTFPITDK